MSNPYISPFAKPVYVMLKPVGSVCNLACEYCYYLEKGKLYPEVKNHIMSEQLLEKFIKEYLECQTMPQVLFTWHGGETLMRPISFYRKALELQRKYGHRRQIDNCIQTNGTLLNDDWCRFFKENNFLVGVSIDGPQEFHDEYRRNKQGLPSFYKVMKGIELLKKHGVEYNAMAVVNDYNVDYPLEFYHFFKEIDCHYIQFTPIVERLGFHQDGTLLTSPEQQDANIKLAPFTVDAGKWGDFLCAVFDEWLKEDVGNYYIQLFDSTLANWVGEQPGVCTLARTCGHAGVMEVGRYGINSRESGMQSRYSLRSRSFSHLMPNLRLSLGYWRRSVNQIVNIQSCTATDDRQFAFAPNPADFPGCQHQPFDDGSVFRTRKHAIQTMFYPASLGGGRNCRHVNWCLAVCAPVWT